MAARKYGYYQIAHEFGGVENTEDYPRALSIYRRLANSNNCKVTLWGIDFQGDFHCIMAK